MLGYQGRMEKKSLPMEKCMDWRKYKIRAEKIKERVKTKCQWK